MDIKKLDHLFLPVEKVKVEEIMPGYEHPSGISHAIITKKPDGTPRVLQYCSNLYHLVSNEEIIPPFIQEMEKLWKIDVDSRVRHFSQFFVDLVLSDFDIKVMPLDTIFPRVRISNSYDGRIKFNYSIGFYRKVCGNGLSIPIGFEKKIKKLHTPSLSELTNFGAITQMAQEFVNNADDISESFYELKSSRIRNPELRIEEIIEETKFPVTAAEDVLESLQNDMAIFGITEVNDWLIYNAFNYQLNHNVELKTGEKKREEIDSEILTFLLES